MKIVAATRKTAIALVALAAAGFAAAAITPAEAGPRHGHGHGYGHHHGHHFHGHRPFRGPMYRPGYVYGGAGLIGGLALGAIAANAMAAQPTCYMAQQPVVDRWGNVIRYRAIRVCD